MQLKRAHWCRAVYFILKAPAVDAASRPGDEKVLAINLTRETRESASNISESDDDFTVDHRTPEDIIVARDDQRNEGITISHFTGGPVGWSSKLFASLIVDCTSATLDRARSMVRSPEGYGADLIPERIWIYPQSSSSNIAIVGAFDDILSLARHEAASSVTLSQALAAARVSVKTFSGCAVWSYSQLLQESSKGSWRVLSSASGTGVKALTTPNAALKFMWPVLLNSNSIGPLRTITT